MRRFLSVLALALMLVVLAVAAGCGDDDDGGDDSRDAVVQRIELTFADLTGDQELSLQVAPDGQDGTAAFVDSEPQFGGELTSNNLTAIMGNTLEMQTFAPLSEGSLSLDVDVSDEVTSIELSVNPVPQGATITASGVGGPAATFENGTAVVDLTG